MEYALDIFFELFNVPALPNNQSPSHLYNKLYIFACSIIMSYNILYEDQELLRLLQQGSRKAYVIIYQKYQKLLFLYAYRKLNDQQEAEDVVQEVFISFWNKRYSLNPDLSLAGYLYRAVRNRAFNIFAHKEIETKYLESLNDFLTNNTESADGLIREHQIAELIAHEISMLPPKMRKIFELSRSNHLSYKEIALELDISEYTVATQIKRALKILRIKLGFYIFYIYFLGMYLHAHTYLLFISKAA